MDSTTVHVQQSRLYCLVQLKMLEIKNVRLILSEMVYLILLYRDHLLGYLFINTQPSVA